MIQLVRFLVLWTAIIGCLIIFAMDIGGACHATNRAEDSLDQRLPNVPAAIYVSASTQLESTDRLSDVYSSYLPIVQKGEVHPWEAWAAEHPAGEPPEAAIVTRDGHMIAVHPGFAAGYDSVMWQESRYDCSNYNWIEVKGVWYEQLGCMQLLFDSAIRRRSADLGFSRDDLLGEAANLIVANSWWGDTQDWSRWSAKPKWYAVAEQK